MKVSQASQFCDRWFPRISLLVLCLLISGKSAGAQNAHLADLSQQGQTALRDQQFDRAQKLYEEIVQLDPGSAQAHSNLGLALYMNTSYSRAIRELQKAIELDSRLDRPRVLLALSYFDTGDLDHAIPLLEKVYPTGKDDPVIVAHLGLAYMRQEKDDKALALLTRWAELEPNSPDALYFKGKAALYVASNSFAQLSKLAPDSYRMFQLRAEMLHQQGNASGAIAEYKKAIAQKPDAAGLHYELGILYREGERPEDALAEFNQELKISPNDGMTDYLIGDIYLRQNKVEVSQKYLSLAVSLQPGNAAAQLDLAKTYQAQGKADAALKILQSFVATYPDDQNAHYLLFGLYKQQGQMDAARKELQLFEALKRKAADQEQKRMRLDSLD